MSGPHRPRGPDYSRGVPARDDPRVSPATELDTRALIRRLLVEALDQLTVSATASATITYADRELSVDVVTAKSVTVDVDGVQLVNDAASPGANQVYGTDGSGVKGWKPDPSGAGHDPVTVTDTDTVDLTLTVQDLEADVRLQMSLTSDASGVKLVNDNAAPGANKVYGTDGTGVKGWKADPSGSGGGVDLFLARKLVSLRL